MKGCGSMDDLKLQNPAEILWNEIRDRVRIYVVPEQLIIHLLNGLRGPDTICLPVFEGIPEGAVVAGICPDFEQRAILVRVHHISFETVEPGCMARRVDVGQLGMRLFVTRGAR